jgi:imidazolonepropionase-like amidohydrolase
MTLLPGLIESHAHVTDAGDLRQALGFGVTTVLDLGSVRVPASTVFALREAARSDMTMADLRSAGDPATAPAGHEGVRSTNLVKPVVATVAEARAFAATSKAGGSDYVKIILNGVRTATTGAGNLDAARTAALVNGAHALGMIAVAHIETVDDAEIALAAGIDGFVHVWRRGGPHPDLARRLAARGVWVMPTVNISDGFMPAGALALLADPRWQSLITASIREKPARPYGPKTGAPDGLRALAQGQLDSAGNLDDVGVRLLVGTDASEANPAAFGISMFREMELLQSTGLTASEVLTAATASPAEAFRLSDRGRVLPGRRADLLLVRGDPTTDLMATRDIVRVWRGGIETIR